MQLFFLRFPYFYCLYRPIGLMSRVFTNGLGDRVSIRGRVIPKMQKWYLIPPYLTLSIIRYRPRVKRGNPGKGVAASLHLGVVAIEKGAFGSLLSTVTNFTLKKKGGAVLDIAVNYI